MGMEKHFKYQSHARRMKLLLRMASPHDHIHNYLLWFISHCQAVPRLQYGGQQGHQITTAAAPLPGRIQQAHVDSGSLLPLEAAKRSMMSAPQTPRPTGGHHRVATGGGLLCHQEANSALQLSRFINLHKTEKIFVINLLKKNSFRIYF